MIGKGLFCYNTKNYKETYAWNRHIIGLWFVDDNKFEEHRPDSDHVNVSFSADFYISMVTHKERYYVGDETIQLNAGKIDRYTGEYINKRDKTVLKCNILTNKDLFIEKIWEKVEERRKDFEVKHKLYKKSHKEKLKKIKF